MSKTEDSIQLVLAAESGNLEDVKRLITEGVPVDQRDTREPSRLQTPLMRASASDHAGIVKALLDAGADVNARSTDGTPLTYGEKMMLYHTRTEDTEAAGVALGWTALHQAARADAVEVIDVLLAAGADIEAETLFKARPIHSAGDSSSANAFRRLLEAGANVNARGSGKSTPLHEAAGWGQKELVEMLVQAKGVKLDLKDGEGHTALMLAVDHERRRCVKLLLDAGASVEIKDRHGKTAADHAQQAGGKVRSLFFAETKTGKPQVTDEQLHTAVQDGDLETIQDAIDQGMDLEKRYDDWALLPTAVLHSSVKTVQKLLNAGIDVEQKNGLSGAGEYQGASALMMTFVGSIPDLKAESMREILLQAGADINTTNAIGWTPLMHVATYMYPDYLTKTLKWGANPHFKSEYGESALSALRNEWSHTKPLLTPENEEDFRNRFEQVREILIEAGTPDRPEIEHKAFEAVAAKDDSLIAGLLKDGLDPNTADYRDTLLQKCLDKELLDSAVALLNAGADAGRVTPDNRKPPLFSAVSHGDVNLIKLMIGHGANPTVGYGDTSILDYLPRKKELREAIREVLVEAAPELAVTKADLGVATFDGSYSALLVKAAGKRVAQSIAQLLPGDAKHWQPREGIPKINGYLVLTWTDRVDPIRWATVHPLRTPEPVVYEREFAKNLSAEVKNDVILFRNSDTAGWFGYDYFKKGKLVEQFQLFPEDSISLDGDTVFETSLREATLPQEGSLLPFVNESLAEFGAYVPGFEEIHEIDDAGERLRGHFVVKVAR